MSNLTLNFFDNRNSDFLSTNVYFGFVQLSQDSAATDTRRCGRFYSSFLCSSSQKARV